MSNANQRFRTLREEKLEPARNCRGPRVTCTVCKQNKRTGIGCHLSRKWTIIICGRFVKRDCNIEIRVEKARESLDFVRLYTVAIVGGCPRIQDSERKSENFKPNSIPSRSPFGRDVRTLQPQKMDTRSS